MDIDDTMRTSPGYLAFLGSLHTGFTPPRDRRAKKPRPVARQLYDEDGGDDRRWEPKGLDGFVCRARAARLRGRATRGGRRGAGGGGSGRPTRHCGVAAMRDAAKRFRQASAAIATLTALEGTTASPRSESEDEAAPVASVPPLDAGAGDEEFV